MTAAPHKWIRMAKITCFVTLTGLGFQNCSPHEFTQIDPELKQDKLNAQQVFGDDSGEIGVNGGSDGTGKVPTKRNPASLPITDGNGEDPSGVGVENAELPLEFVCSNVKSAQSGNLAQASEVKIEMVGTSGVACSFKSTTLRNQILNTRKMPLALVNENCSSLINGNYELRLLDSKRAGARDLFLNRMLMKKTSTGISAMENNSRILTDLNDGDDDVERLMPNVACDHRASPLVIHLDSDTESAEPLKLTSQANGINFDILGRNAEPQAHSPRRISWHRSHQYVYIALPNQFGKVNGIDELFGDNTFGPDGKFANDGYHALAKYDGKTADGKSKISEADGYITGDDEIYSKLRLWQDKNFDGKAQSGELTSLKQRGITIIDLNFDANYSETDAHGNQTKFKSVVADKNGKVHLLFDVWFHHQKPVAAPILRRLASQ